MYINIDNYRIEYILWGSDDMVYINGVTVNGTELNIFNLSLRSIWKLEEMVYKKLGSKL